MNLYQLFNELIEYTNLLFYCFFFVVVVNCRKAQELSHQGRTVESRRFQEIHEERALQLRELPVLESVQPHPLHPTRMHLRPALERPALLAQAQARAPR